MGSWNGTCGVTQLPIHAGDEVALFLLVGYGGRQESSTGHCSPMEFWAPRSIQLYGTYNDYGWFEIEDGWNKEFTINCFQNDALEVEGDKKYRDNEVTREKLKDWDFIGQALHEGHLIVSQKQQPISLMAVHRHIFDAIIKEGVDHWSGPLTLDKYIKSGQKYFMEIRRQSSNEILRRFRILETREIFASAFQSNEGNIRTFHNNAGTLYQEIIRQLLDDNEAIVDEEEFILEISKYNLFNVAMHMMRKNWCPQSGAGSQSEEYELYETVFKAAAEVIAKRRAVYDEDEEWEDE